MNRWVSRARRNECGIDAALTVDGRLFHALAAATVCVRSCMARDLLAITKSLVNICYYCFFQLGNRLGHKRLREDVPQ